MENASKALIIAGSILIAIMIVSVGILIFNRMGGSAKNAANMDEQEIAEFNSKITPYIGTSVSGSQVNALIGYVISTNLVAAKAGDASKSLTITYKYKEGASTVDNTISLDSNSSPFSIKYSNSAAPKRVPTGAGKFYTVEAENGKDGLIENVTVNQN